MFSTSLLSFSIFTSSLLQACFVVNPMDTKFVTLITLCLFPSLLAASAQTNPPFRELEMPPRKLLLLGSATGPTLPASHEHRRPGQGGSFLLPLLLFILASLGVSAARNLCRRHQAQNPQIQSAALASAENVRPTVTCNFINIGSCFRVN